MQGLARVEALGRAEAVCSQRAICSTGMSVVPRPCSKVGQPTLAVQRAACRCTRPSIAALALHARIDPIEWSPFSVWLSLLLHAHGEKRPALQGSARRRGMAAARSCSTAFITSSIRRIHLSRLARGPAQSRASCSSRKGLPMRAHRALAARISWRRIASRETHGAVSRRIAAQARHRRSCQAISLS